MSGSPVSQDEAIAVFMNMLIRSVYEGPIKEIAGILQDGPPGREPQAHLRLLHEAYLHLGEDLRAQMMVAVKEAVDAAVFGFLVFLDGAWGGYPIKGTVSDFALYLHTYDSQNARELGMPATSVRLNPAFPTLGLHDRLRSHIAKASP
jgi:hypothetical protein